MPVRVATAECFTHGLVAREIHSFSRGYPCHHSFGIKPDQYRISLEAGLFIPTLSGLINILKINPSPPLDLLDGIKVYDQQGDYATALLMAESVRERTGSDIGIGTTAGIGKGGIAIVNASGSVITSSGVYADLLSSPGDDILKRQNEGVRITLILFEKVITGQITLTCDSHPVLPDSFT